MDAMLTLNQGGSMSTPIRLRAVTRAEQRLLRAKLKDLSLSARIHQRYRVIDEVRRGPSIGEAAQRAGRHFPPPHARGGAVVGVALSNRGERGFPFAPWSVPKLAEYCRRRRLLPPVTDEWVRRLLRREGLTAQRIRTWKTSSDPTFDRKKNASADSIGSARRARP